MPKPSLFRLSDVIDRLRTTPAKRSCLIPFVNTENSQSMGAGVNLLNRVSVPWELTFDEVIVCHKGTFRLIADDVPYVCNEGDMIFLPKGMSIKYECDEECIVFYAIWPVDWRQRQGIETVAPGVEYGDD